MKWYGLKIASRFDVLEHPLFGIFKLLVVLYQSIFREENVKKIIAQSSVYKRAIKF